MKIIFSSTLMLSTYELLNWEVIFLLIQLSLVIKRLTIK